MACLRFHRARGGEKFAFDEETFSGIRERARGVADANDVKDDRNRSEQLLY